MPTLTLRLPDEISERLATLAKLTGRTKTHYALKAIEDQLEDMEDLYLATAALERYKRSEERVWSHEEIGAKLGLDN